MLDQSPVQGYRHLQEVSHDLDLDSDLEHIHYPRRVTSRRVFRARTMISDLAGRPGPPEFHACWRTRKSGGSSDITRPRIWSCPLQAASSTTSTASNTRLFGFEMALELGRPVVILGQSVGPFWKPRSKERAREVLSRLDAVLLREEHSLRHLQTCGVDMSRVLVATDIAFYWRRMAAHLFVEKKGPGAKDRHELSTVDPRRRLDGGTDHQSRRVVQASLGDER